MQYIAHGGIGSGFPNESLDEAYKVDLDFIGADAGTNDVGPYQLGGIGTIFSGPLCRYDLRRLLVLARTKKIPFLIGSCGGSGSDWGVDWFAGMIREIAREEQLAPFKVARIYSEVDRDALKQKMRAGRMHPLAGPHMPYSEEHVERSTRIVGVMGAEPFQAALAAGADVVLAGRATDTAIFSSIPLSKGYPPATAWHAAKVAECGGAIGEPARSDLLLVRMQHDSYVVSPLLPTSRCTVRSSAAHQLYENADSIVFVEPSGTINASAVTFTVADARSVRISGATFAPTRQYTMKLEGVEPCGYQAITMASYNDRVLLEEMPAYIERCRAEIETKIARVFGEEVKKATLTIRTYGAGNMSDLFGLTPLTVPANDVFFLMDVVAPSQEMASSVATVAWHTLIHFSPQGWSGSFVTGAWPFNPPVIERGVTYRWNVNHVIEMDDPLDGVRTEYEEVR